MKLNISESTKKMIYCLLGIAIVLAAFFFGFRRFNLENKQLKVQKETLDKELEKLDEIQKNQSDYESQLKDYEKQVQDYYKEFPVLVQARDQILYASELESRYNSMFINKMDIGEAEYVVGTAGDAIALFRVPAKIECYIDYDQLKKFLVKTTEDGTKKAVDSIVLTKDAATGSLVGSIDISMYYMTGIDQEYEPEPVDDVTVGTPNIFQNTVVPQQ